MNRPDPLPCGRRGLVLALVVVAAVAGCRPSAPFRLHILSEPLEITATASEDSPDDGAFRFEIVHGTDRWSVPTRLGAGWKTMRDDIELTVSRLRELIAWKSPYLFVREKNPEGDPAWRRDVDHVFRIESNSVVRIGTVSAKTGGPGDQYQEGLFFDLYDRLEFTLVTTHDQAPGFAIVMRENQGRFVVDRKETWQRGEARLQEAWEVLRTFGQPARRPATAAERRRVVAQALFGLAFATYCDREEELQTGFALARKALGSVEDLRAEISSIVPGELAPSADRVLRDQPGLVNFFKESTQIEREPPLIRSPPSVASPSP